MDVFGIPVSLTYKNEPRIKSVTGGFATIIMRCGVLAYLLYRCADVFARKTAIQSSSHILDLSNENLAYKLTQDEFDLAFKVEYTLLDSEPEVQENIEEYAYIQLSQNIYTWVTQNGRSVQLKQRHRIETEICKYGRLGLKEDGIDYLNIVKTYQCPKKVDFQLQGSYSARIVQQVQIGVFPCNQTYLDITTNKTKKCKPKAEQVRVGANLRLFVVVQNSFFDQEAFDSSIIRASLKPYFLSPSFNKSHSYLFLLSKNQVKLQDSMFYGDTQEKQFIDTRLDYLNMLCKVLEGL
ncbi:UNKNOWN [Stylonychia lemnae]|uniref:Uncharacterized protein n=1 Tax=Stylonychia lemnae TaxID=5949 RepID=A0A078AJ11_STYLE|nr:UNKNOWN [Stylonychia lemnae]|eukprot:CDW81876.1 UNKNOWN [Stylonychia lemnae]